MMTITVTEFKAKCLAYFDQMSRSGETMTVTKRGRPLATILPATTGPELEEKPWLKLRGKAVIHADIIAPVLPDSAYSTLRKRRHG